MTDDSTDLCCGGLCFHGDNCINRSPASTPEPATIPTDETPIVDLVIEDLRAREAFGIAKYGTPLQAGNGRRGIVDAYQEALDLVAYVRQEMEQRRRLDEENAALRIENERLVERLADHEDTRRRVLDEPCRADERHCTCVPDLRAEIRTLRSRKRRVEDKEDAIIDTLRSRLAEVEGERDRLRAAGDRLHDDLVLYHPRADVLPMWNAARTTATPPSPSPAGPSAPVEGITPAASSVTASPSAVVASPSGGPRRRVRLTCDIDWLRAGDEGEVVESNRYGVALVRWDRKGGGYGLGDDVGRLWQVVLDYLEPTPPAPPVPRRRVRVATGCALDGMTGEVIGVDAEGDYLVLLDEPHPFPWSSIPQGARDLGATDDVRHRLAFVESGGYLETIESTEVAG